MSFMGGILAAPPLQWRGAAAITIIDHAKPTLAAIDGGFH
ncbi:hypothetical protein HNQ49_002787 [Parapusillimonas granuli]|nr:hypothetical protein [Parapusillimonas granuli]